MDAAEAVDEVAVEAEAEAEDTNVVEDVAWDQPKLSW